MSTACSSASVGALYLHMPFCVRRCRYCDFSTCATRRDDPLMGAYALALQELVRRIADAGLLAQARTAYVGGGTPTLANDALPSLVQAVRTCLPQLCEFSSEGNPESITLDLTKSLAAAGLTRLSLGVQSLDDGELVRLGRVHDAHTARRAMGNVREAGLDLSCDLMCGIPLQTMASWHASLAGACEGGACHVSCYPLMVEEDTPLHAACEAGDEAWPDDDLQADAMLEAQAILKAQGMARYEVASYALSSHACRHNLAYWSGVPYLGLGSSAASMLTPELLATLAQAVPLVCEPEDPEVADAGLWEQAGPESSGASGSPDNISHAQDKLKHALTPGADLARRALQAGPERVARIRLRMTDPARDLVRKLGEGEPLAARVETLTAREALAEDLMLAARTSQGAPAELLARARACMGGSLDETLERVAAEGLAHLTSEGALAPTERGWLLGNELYGALWDLAAPDAPR